MKIDQVKNLLYEFWQQISDACPLECGEAEKQEKLFSEFVENKLKSMSFEEASSYMMKYLSENQHPHTMAEIDSTKAILWEGLIAHHDESYLID